LISEKRAKAAMEIAKNEYKTFSGKVVKDVSITDIDKFSDLAIQEASDFLMEIFSQNSDNGFVKLGNRVVMYKILDQRIADKGTELEKDVVIKIKEQIRDQNLIKRLRDVYPIESYI
jgi:uncharacterized protein YehS (DUF1456 family)